MKQLLLILFLINFTAYSQDLTGTWKFSSISDSSNNLIKEIHENDVIIFKNDSSFSYSLKKNNLSAQGTYSSDNQKITLFYSLPKDTIRNYSIIYINRNKLKLYEDEIYYNFVKIQTSNIKKLEGLNFNSFFRGLLGLLSLIFLAWLISSNKKNIPWGLVLKGIVIQFIFAIGILKIPLIQSAFDWVSSGFVTILSFTREGSLFLFGSLIENTSSFGFIFAFQVLPTIIFFSALTSLLFYYGVLQKIVFAFAWIMKKTLKLSGAESLAAAGNIFLGQTESPLLIKPYLDKMTLSELLCLMSGGMATIAGGVLMAYIGFLGGEDPAKQIFFAKHLLAASLMSAPAAVIAAKILLPEKEHVNDEMEISKEKLGANALEAITIGTKDGLKLAVNVGAMLLVFIALIAMLNYFLGNFIGEITGLNNWVEDISKGRYEIFSLQFILGYSLAPITWLMGVCKEDMVILGQLLGEKTVLNEFIAYKSLGDFKNALVFTQEKSIIMATYILCGFANFSSIGIQIGGIGALAPSRRSYLSKLGIKSLIAGTFASLFTAVIVGMLI